MDRNIVYPGSIPLDSDILTLNRNTMAAIGGLIRAVFGVAPVIDGLAVTPTQPLSMTVTVGAGSITSYGAVDYFPYGSLAPDSGNGLQKMGINLSSTPIVIGAPFAPGQSMVSIVEVSFTEVDTNPVVLPYFNAAAPDQPWLGPNNNGQVQPTQRIQRAALRARAGTPAATGSQLAPASLAGWYPIAAVTTSYAQTAIDVLSIAPSGAAPVIPFKLPQLRPGFSSMQVFSDSGTFVVPVGVTTVKVRAFGGGGGGGGNTTQGGGGGGGGGGYVEGIVAVNPGQAILIVVGGGGAGGSNASGSGAGNAGQDGGASIFGTVSSAGGGHGGQGSISGGQGNSGPGGIGIGGMVNMTGGAGNAGFSGGVSGFGGHGAAAASGGGGGGASSGLPSAGAAPGGGGAGGGGNFGGAPGARGAVIIEY